MIGLNRITLRQFDTVTAFCVGFAIVLLALTVSIPPVWDTFIHPWRVEIYASAFLLAFLLFGITRLSSSLFSPQDFERRFIILPILAFLMWSALSVIWSNSPRSAIHHTLVWSLYFTFYCCVRSVLNNRGTYRAILTACVVPLLFFSALAILGYLIVSGIGRGPALGIIYSKYGEQINTLLPLLVLGTLRSSSKRFRIYVCIIGVLWLMIFASSSRTAIGLFIVGLVSVTASVIVLKRLRPYRMRMAVIVSVILCVSGFLTVVPRMISGSDDPTLSRLQNSGELGNSNDFRRLMISIGLEMVVENPVLGVGADNFGFEANRYRAKVATENPENPTLSQAEMFIPERAHNEYLQIAAELGLVGATIFAWLLIGIALLGFRGLIRYKATSLHGLAAIIGLGLFLASSLVTSYSFRLAQNGFIFFFVLAVAVRAIERQSATQVPVASKHRLALLRTAGATACILMLAICGIRVTSVAITKAANSDPDMERATSLYEKAVSLDPENPEAPYYLGLRLLIEHRYDEAARSIKESIRIGKAPSVDYSYLATAQSLAGDSNSAEQTLAEAAVLYPRSVFVLSRYSAMLRANGKTTEAILVAEKARSLDARSANTWLALIELGANKTSSLAFVDSNYRPVMDLEPYDCIYAVVTERHIRFPEERIKIRFELDTAQNAGN